jgi:hypothetical protein
MFITDRPTLRHNEIRFMYHDNGAVSTFVHNFMRIRYNTKDELWFQYNEQTNEYDLIEIITHDDLRFYVNIKTI